MEKRIRQIIFIAGIMLMTAGGVMHFSFRHAKSLSWEDAVAAAKKSVVEIKSTGARGAGFFLSSDGVIATSSGVTGQDKTVEVQLSTGELKKAAVTRSGPAALDVAILKIDEQGNGFAAAAGSAECRDGEEIRVLGAAQGEFVAKKGIIIHCNNEQDGVRYVQTDIPFDGASIGSPCIDKNGKVLGLYSSLRTGSGQVLGRVLPMAVVQNYKDGMLTSLEEALIRKEAERAKEQTGTRNLSAEADHIYRKLQQTADGELQRYLAGLDTLRRSGAITYEQGKAMAELMHYGPDGSVSMAAWVRYLSGRVMNGTFTEDQAITIIKAHFRR
jgi:S1-C subfamily serine protease